MVGGGSLDPSKENLRLLVSQFSSGEAPSENKGGGANSWPKRLFIAWRPSAGTTVAQLH